MSDTPATENTSSDAPAPAPAAGGTGGIGDPVKSAQDKLLEEKTGEGTLTEDDKNWGLLAHISILASMAVPLGNILGPLVVYLAKKDQSKFVHFHALQSLIFQVVFTVGMIVLAIPMIILGVLSGGLLFIPIAALAGLVSIGALVYAIVMGIRAKDGKWVLYIIAGNIAYEKVFKTPAPPPA